MKRAGTAEMKGDRNYNMPVDHDEPVTLEYARSGPSIWRRLFFGKLIFATIAIGIFLLGTLVMAVPDLHGPSRRSAQKLMAQSAVDSSGPLAMALKMFQLHTKHYPARLTDLVSQPPQEPRWQGPYIADPTPLKDPWGEDFHYKSPGADGRPYDLWSSGPDKQSGDEDDITNW